MKKTLFVINIGLVILLGAVLSYLLLLNNHGNSLIPPEYIIALTSSGNGYGYDSGDQEIKRHYPMAHSLIVSSEANRYTNTQDKSAFRNTIQNADWLVKNKDIDNDGIIGWGLPFAWDAFGDGSENTAHTEYTITTALSIQGLLDAVDAIDKSNTFRLIYKNRREIYLKTAQETVDSFIENKFYTKNPNGTINFWYSVQSQDSKFVTNCHAMFIGNLQRLSTYSIINKNKKKIYQDLADKGIGYLLQTKKEKGGGWYWIYYPESKKPHEDHGVHVAYTADGILKYKEYGGRLSDKIDNQKILNGLTLYVRNNKILAMFSQPELPIRSWGLGYFLYVVSKYYPQETEMQEIIYQEILERQEKNGFRFKEGKSSPTNFVRFNAHVLIGLSKYFWN